MTIIQNKVLAQKEEEETKKKILIELKTKQPLSKPPVSLSHSFNFHFTVSLLSLNFFLYATFISFKALIYSTK